MAAQLQAAQAAHSHHQQQHQQQKAAAAEAVEDHFRMSMELAKKVSKLLSKLTQFFCMIIS